MTGVEIVPFDEELLDAAARLRAVAWGSTPERNRAYLEWKYLQNPYLPDPLLSLAVAGGRVIGMRGSTGTCWEVDGGRLVLPHAGDLLVDPDYRRRGIATAMWQAACADMVERGHGWTLSLSANPLGRARALSSGWVELAQFSLLECAAPAGRAATPTMARRLRGRIRASRSAAALLRLRRRALPARRDPLDRLGADGDVTVTRSPTAADIAMLADTAPSDDRLRHVRDAEYYAWRLASPLEAYRVVSAPGAFVVLRQEAGSAGVDLVDWRFVDAEQLARVVVRAVRAVPYLRLWSASLDEAMHRALHAAGHVAAGGASSAFIVRRLQPAGTSSRRPRRPLDDLSSWDVRMLDSDAV